jgi:hypothetical protein
MKNAIFWDVMPRGSIIRVPRIGEPGTLEVTSNWHVLHVHDGGATFLRNIGSYKNHMV